MRINESCHQIYLSLSSSKLNQKHQEEIHDPPEMDLEPEEEEEEEGEEEEEEEEEDEEVDEEAREPQLSTPRIKDMAHVSFCSPAGGDVMAGPAHSK